MWWRRRWWKGVCIFGVAILISLLLTTPALAWWNIDWKYRRPITIQSENVLTGYQVPVELNSTNFDFTKAKPDGSDIRFVDENDVTKLSYWIEEWNASAQTAKVWVNVSLIPAGEKVIYLYYGNPNTVSESNGSTTFRFFDDFNSLSNWEQVSGTSEVSNSILIMDEVDETIKTSWNSVFGRWVIKFRYTNLPTSNYDGYRIHIEYDGNNFWECFWGVDNHPTSICNHIQDVSEGSSGYTIVGEAQPYTDGNWHIWEIVRNENYSAIYIDGNLIGETNTIYYNTVAQYLKIVNQDDADTETDWIFISQYTYPEPIITIGAEEEIPPLITKYISPSTLQVKLYFTEKSGYIFIGTSPDKFSYAYEYHGRGTYTLTTTFLLPNKTYYIKACDIDGCCTDVVEFVCSEKTDLEKKNFTSAFNNLMQGGNMLNISKLGETLPSIYTTLLTDMFWAMFFGGIFLAYWIRQEDVMLPSIVGMISGIAMIGMLPPSAQHIAYILLVISIAGTLYTIIKARR
ncbi:MAG: hypothetical protein EJNHJLOP_00016 [Methanophagales virus PBV082]|uniref:DUF2341 domain-containing protein n=1 Tax=Methanophagales virus PBV082 TaxID=3071307 RepID=A0AA46TDG7_9VIRU|nr:MAG: hypothetical protein QIT52_gp16 [Methanophagales virus PBV082]UYL64905.1 MAG: hypothetical protein EJNHJLOP_00016 [Methanophagales virus PBV082]